MLPVLARWLALFVTQEAAPAQPNGQPPAGPSPPTASQSPLPGDCSAPVLTYKVDPEFNMKAQNAKVLGKVVVALIVDARGNPINVHISKSLVDPTAKKRQQAAAQSLDQSAVDAVRQYRFKPATCAGKPVAVVLQVAVNFQIVKQ